MEAARRERDGAVRAVRAASAYPSALVAAALLLSAPPARAQPEAPAPVDLQWRAPPSCPTRAEVLAALARLRPPGATRASSPVRVVAAVETRDDGAWSLTLESHAGPDPSRRHLVTPSCAQAASATALIVALVLDTAPAARATPRPAVPPPRSTTPWQLALRASASADLGSLPAPSPGLELTASLTWRRLRVEGSFTYWFAQRAMADRVGGDIGLVTGSLRGCALLHRGRWEPRLCGVVEGGAMHGTSVGLPQTNGGSSPWWAALVGVAVGWRVSDRVSLHAGVDAGVPLSAPDFVIGGVGQVHRPGDVLLRGALGAEWRFL